MQETGEASSEYSILDSVQTPSHITSLAFGHSGHLFAGSVDGSLRLYDLSSLKVLKAIRALGSEVSSIVSFKRTGSEFRDVWLGCGRRALSFKMDSKKPIQTSADATSVIDLGENDDDALNELALNSKNSHLAFSLDSGVVGVVDLSTKNVTRMKIRHQNVCGTVKFIPDRPRELVSGGYDTALLHFDFLEGTLLSRREIPPFLAVEGISLAPPFVMSTALSSSGVIAIGTADGRLLLGFGGEKRLSAKKASAKKRSRKWEGLKEDAEQVIEIAEGPIVAMAFSDPKTLTFSTLLGVITQCLLVPNNKTEGIGLAKIWQRATKTINKVNALIMDDKRLIIGGLDKSGKGVIEVWSKDDVLNSLPT